MSGRLAGKVALVSGGASGIGAALNTTPDFWLNAQKAMDLYNTSRSLSNLPKPLFRKAS